MSVQLVHTTSNQSRGAQANLMPYYGHPPSWRPSPSSPGASDTDILKKKRAVFQGRILKEMWRTRTQSGDVTIRSTIDGGVIAAHRAVLSMYHRRFCRSTVDMKFSTLHIELFVAWAYSGTIAVPSARLDSLRALLEISAVLRLWDLSDAVFLLLACGINSSNVRGRLQLAQNFKHINGSKAIIRMLEDYSTKLFAMPAQLTALERPCEDGEQLCEAEEELGVRSVLGRDLSSATVAAATSKL